jgi:adenylosuccinate lyase
MKYRVIVECEYVIALAETKGVGIKPCSKQEVAQLRGLCANFSDADYAVIKGYEATTRHDVKSVEYFLKDKLRGTSAERLLEWVHFGLTSSDINACAYALMLGNATQHILVPALLEVRNQLGAMAHEHANLSMLARTHGQSASPTTFGKECAVFVSRIDALITALQSYAPALKLNGATGNYNALALALPKVQWLAWTEAFAKKLTAATDTAVSVTLVTTQIDPHDTYAELFSLFHRANTIVLDCMQDFWRYCSDDYVKLVAKKGEVGSSTMPHKVNPIDFENAEGNCMVANAHFEMYMRKLPISRLQRDLSDSTVERTFGNALGHTLLAYRSAHKGFSRIIPNEERITADLSAHPEVLAEGIQTVMRAAGLPVPYEQLKEMTRGTQVTLSDFQAFIATLNVPSATKKILQSLTPSSYIGLAAEIAVSVPKTRVAKVSIKKGKK